MANLAHRTHPRSTTKPNHTSNKCKCKNSTNLLLFDPTTTAITSRNSYHTNSSRCHSPNMVGINAYHVSSSSNNRTLITTITTITTTISTSSNSNGHSTSPPSSSTFPRSPQCHKTICPWTATQPKLISLRSITLHRSTLSINSSHTTLSSSSHNSNSSRHSSKCAIISPSSNTYNQLHSSPSSSSRQLLLNHCLTLVSSRRVLLRTLKTIVKAQE